MLPVLSKILEKDVQVQMMEFLENNNNRQTVWLSTEKINQYGYNTSPQQNQDESGQNM